MRVNTIIQTQVSYLTYYPNDIVRINVPIDNDFSTNNQYDGNQINQVRATYICILEHTTDVLVNIYLGPRK